MRFSDLVGVDRRPAVAEPVSREPIDTDTYRNQLSEDPRNNGFVSGLFDARRSRRMKTGRRGFLRGTVAAAAATTAVSAATLFGPAKRVEAQSGGIVGTYPRRILQFCPPYNSGDNCQPGCGSSPICTDCCGSDGFFRNDPSRGYTLYAGGCGDGDIADGWLWRYKGVCGNCAEIEYRCSDGYVQTDQGPAPFICRTVTDCVPLADGQAAGPALADAARSTNWRPAGRLEVAVDQGSAVSLTGWIADGSGSPVQMRIRANNQIVFVGAAGLARPDIANAVRGAGPNTGFAVSIPFDSGEYELCVDAMSGVLISRIGCVRLRVGSGATVAGGGSVGSISPPASSSSTAPADPNATPAPAPTPTEIVLPERGDRSETRTFGAVQVIRRTAATTGFVSGWAGDPDTGDAAYIDVVVDGESALVTRAVLPRPDVAEAFAELGSATGFAGSFALPEGPAEVCVFAVDPQDGRRRPLGCQELRAVATDADEPDTDADSPTASGSAVNGDTVYGGIDEVSVTGSEAVVTGWAFDPNDRDRAVSIRVEGAGDSVRTETGLDHPVSQQVYGLTAPGGFRAELTLPTGEYDLTVQAITAAGSAVELGGDRVEVT